MDVVNSSSRLRSRAPGRPVESAAARPGAVPAALLTLLFAAAVGFIAAHHEPWFDEAQAWLIGRDCGLWELLAGRVRYEGSPGLWHAILWVLSHAGMPFDHLWLVSVACASAGAWIVLRYAPFPLWLRIAVVCSYFVAYQYAVVARSYALALILVPLLATNFEQRLRRPILYCLVLALLANTSAHTFLIAAVAFLELTLASWRAKLWGERRIVGAAALYLACAAAAVLQAWPPGDVSFPAHANALRIPFVVAAAFIDRLDLLATIPPSGPSILAGAALSIVLLVPSGILFARAHRFALVGTIALVLLAFSALKHANLWHGGILYLVWIFGLWISWHATTALVVPADKLLMASVATIVLVHDGYSVAAGWRDIRSPYSSGPAAARLLAPRRDGGIAAVGFKTFSIQPWFDRNLFANYRRGAPQPAYLLWRSGETIQFNDRLDIWHALATAGTFDTLVLSTWELPPGTLADYAREATAAGFCAPEAVPGGLVWKSYVHERDDLLIFRRCPP